MRLNPESASYVGRIRDALLELELPFDEFERGGLPARQEFFDALLDVAVYFVGVDGCVTADERLYLHRLLGDSFAASGLSVEELHSSIDEKLKAFLPLAPVAPRILAETQQFDAEFGTSHSDLLKECLFRLAVITCKSDKSVPGAEHDAMRAYKRVLYGSLPIKIS